MAVSDSLAQTVVAATHTRQRHVPMNNPSTIRKHERLHEFTFWDPEP
jgi:hypothetical protein